MISFTYGVVRYVGTWGGCRTEKTLDGKLFYSSEECFKKGKSIPKTKLSIYDVFKSLDCCMEAYGDDYISTMKSFGDLTNTEAYGWEYVAKILIEKLNNVPVDSWEQYLVDLLKGKPRSKEPVYFMKYVKNNNSYKIPINREFIVRIIGRL